MEQCLLAIYLSVKTHVKSGILQKHYKLLTLGTETKVLKIYIVLDLYCLNSTLYYSEHWLILRQILITTQARQWKWDTRQAYYMFIMNTQTNLVFHWERVRILPIASWITYILLSMSVWGHPESRYWGRDRRTQSWLSSTHEQQRKKMPSGYSADLHLMSKKGCMKGLSRKAMRHCQSRVEFPAVMIYQNSPLWRTNDQTLAPCCALQLARTAQNIGLAPPVCVQPKMWWQQWSVNCILCRINCILCKRKSKIFLERVVTFLTSGAI